MVKELREATGAGVLDAKKALEAHDGNFDKAVDFLREKGLARAATRAGREAKEGIVEVYAHPGSRMAVIMELNCETDFVARNEMFRTLAHDLVVHIAAARPRYIRQEDVPQAELDREMDVLRSQARAEGKPDQMVEKIVAGRLNKFYEEICLMEQPFVRDESVKIKDMIADAMRTTGENIILRRFDRYELGEAL
jgi:elongation factor Ts